MVSILLQLAGKEVFIRSRGQLTSSLLLQPWEAEPHEASPQEPHEILQQHPHDLPLQWLHQDAGCSQHLAAAALGICRP